jgi:hypothetical protein
LIPAAATAGVAASAATAAPPQMNCLLESAITYLSSDLFIWLLPYFTINYEIISSLPETKVDRLGFTSIAPAI